ncbi:hypothetical protein ACIQNG_03890 [Streptomyces sp. NPDC091377]|uniref:hypothetical protein n=1 Tax=Streptomyces sp. NPDC091377 TaxID=3365995 RepID=UPI00380ED024
MTGEQVQGLLAMVAVLGLMLFMTLPALIGAAHERRIDRQLREAEREPLTRQARSGQKSSSRSTVPSTATWYAEGRRSKKFVSS